MIVTIRETAISKLQQLPEVLVQEVSDFIDLLDHKYRVKTFDTQPDGKLIEMWLQWFEGVDGLTVNSPEPINDYQQLLLEKYRQQGLELWSCVMQESCFVWLIAPNPNIKPTEIR